jgi:RNA polymerase II subunit A-like phosphatase
VLSGLVICLSGLVPLGVNIEESEIGMQAQSFGAQVVDSISNRVTHLVVSLARPRTKKVQQAAKISSIKIVNQSWLADCLSQWRRLDESPYYLTILDADRERSEDTADTGSAEMEEAGISINMGDFDEELKEFLGDDDDDEGDDEGDGDEEGEAEDEDNGSETTDSDADDTDDPDQRGTKRKARASTVGESALAKKQRVSRSRGASSLRSVHTNGDTGRPDQDDAVQPPAASADNEANFDYDELERELLAGLEAAGD